MSGIIQRRISDNRIYFRNCSMNKLLSNARGFSLLEVMVAAGIMAVIALGTTHYLLQMQKTIVSYEDKLSTADLKNVIQLELADSQTCRNNFANRNLASTIKISQIQGKNASDIVEQNTKYLSLFDVENIELRNINVPSNPNDQGRMNLEITLSRPLLKPKVYKVDIPVFVTLNASRAIQNCYSIGSSGSGSSDFVEGQMPCIMTITTKTGNSNVQTPLGTYGSMDDYTSTQEFHLHGSTMKRFAFNHSINTCGGAYLMSLRKPFNATTEIRQ